MAVMTKTKPIPTTLHDVDYLKVAQAVQHARGMMNGGNHIDIACPICGGDAWVLPRSHNTGQTPIAMCESGCFCCWE